ncbi:DUF6744 family protein [Psychrobacillus sp. FSL H8-0487]|uniref:DUF6744 family protein n=1 Tax=Psychrobacillus sp. FSL H8-0487 TaxID=2921391 RepID=UPI0030F82A88
MQQNQSILEGVSASINGEQSESIGFLTWYSVGDDLYYREDLRKLLVSNGIEEKYLPNPIRSSDAFRRATKAIETKRSRESDNADTYKNYIVRDVVSKGEKLQRNIVIETVNQKGERLDYNTEGAKMYFDKQNDQFTFISNDEMANDLAEEAQKHYDLFSKAHNGAVVRSSVVSYLYSLSPTPVRLSGGVYFVPFKYAENLKNLCNYVSSLDKGSAQMVALTNDENNRNIIKENVKENLDKVLQQCRSAINDEEGKLQKGQVFTIIEDARRIVGQFKDYRELLNDTVIDLESSVDLIRQSINLVLSKVAD